MAISESRSAETDLFWLDSCSDTHVCNDLDRFYDFKSFYSEAVKVSDIKIVIKDTGSVCIIIEGSSGPEWIELHNVVYCSGFYLNLVFYIRLKTKKMRWNDEIEWLVRNDAKFVRVSNQAE